MTEPDPDAAWIAPDAPTEAAPLLRVEFDLDPGHGPVTRATLALSAHGVVEAWVNGVATSDELLAPGWTSYEWRVRVVEHDVTALVAERSALGVRLGNGWYRGYLGFTGARAVYGEERAAWVALRVEFADGHVQRVRSGADWMASTGSVIADDLYNGQSTDARLEPAGWTRPGFDAAGWQPVRVLPAPTASLEPRTSPPVRRVAELPVREVITSPSGATLLDFGQNLVGFLRVAVRGEAGTAITIRHAEVLEHGELGTRPLRAAKATDTHILSGGDDVFEPTLTFHGFRYAEVTGWPGEFDPAAVTAVVVASDIDPIGEFACSDPLLEQLHRNVEWSMRGNFLSIPTDCPQRDERLGWTGDLSVFAPTAAFLGDVESFLSDWLVDVELERRANGGAVPVVAPDALKFLDTGFPAPGATAVWGDAAVWVPWALWRAYGRIDTLRAHWSLMTGHGRGVAAALSPDGVWDTGFQFGDWLDPDAPVDDPGKAKADPGVVATACAFRTASILAEAAGVLGHDADAAEFGALRDRLRAGFHARYVDAGRVHSDCVTVYALAIAFELLTGDDLRAAGDRLAELVRASGFRISTGFAGTPFVCDALTITGHLDEAYRLLLERTAPSWLYPVTRGATTIWERWDSMLPDGSINPGGMTSFNHYAFGAVADWLHRTVAGLAPEEPGYRAIRVAPRPGGGLTSASAAVRTPLGRASVAWRLDGTELSLAVTVPPGSRGVVDVPGWDGDDLPPGDHDLRLPLPSTTNGAPA